MNIGLLQLKVNYFKAGFDQHFSLGIIPRFYGYRHKGIQITI